MAGRLRIAYLTSLYGRSGDTFIRDEIGHLRAMGLEVRTFSIRTPSAGEIVSDAVRQERQATFDLLAAGWLRMIGAFIVLSLTRPIATLCALRRAFGLGTPGFRGRLIPFAYLLEASLLARRLRALHIEHLHNHIGRNSAAVAMLASTLSGVPYSLTIHGPTEFDNPLGLALSIKLRYAKFCVAIGEYGRSQLMRWSRPADWNRIHVVRCGIGREFADAQITPVPNVPRIVSVGRFVEQKGHLVLLRALRKVIDAGHAIELEFVGDGELRGLIEGEIARLRLEGSVKLLGLLSSEKVRDRLNAARAAVLPSFAEGLPVALMEAMALGRPVIGTYVGAIPELIENGVHGWLVPSGSVDALADAIIRLLGTPVETLSQMGFAARTRVLERHDGAREAAKLAELFANPGERS